MDWISEHLPSRRDVVAAIGFAVIWFGGTWFGRHHGWYPKYPELYLDAGLFSVAVLLLRTSWPRTTLLAVAVLYPLVYGSFLVTEFHLLPLLLAAYTATESGRISRLWTLVASELAVTVLYIPLSTWWSVLLDPSTVREQVWTWNLSRLSLAQAAVAAVVLLGHAAFRQRRTTAQLLDRHLELERLRRLETDQVVSAERTRIARELHDVVAHHISAVVIRAQAADRVADSRPEETLAAVRWIATNGQETLAAMRHVVRVLRSTEASGSLAPQATLAELPDIAGRMAAVGLPVDLRMPETTPALPAAVELATVRIIQEALTNVLVHAEATRAVVELQFGPEDEFRIQIHDDGSAGAPPTVPVTMLTARPRSSAATGLGGNGLIGMRERAVSCGGSLTIGVSPLGGWLVTAVLRSTLALPSGAALEVAPPSSDGLPGAASPRVAPVAVPAANPVSVPLARPLAGPRTS